MTQLVSVMCIISVSDVLCSTYCSAYTHANVIPSLKCYAFRTLKHILININCFVPCAKHTCIRLISLISLNNSRMN